MVSWSFFRLYHFSEWLMTHFVVGCPSTICLFCHLLLLNLFTVSSSCRSLFSSMSFFLKTNYLFDMFRHWQNFSTQRNAVQCLPDETWMDASYPQFVAETWMHRTHTLSTRLLITKSSVSHFSGKGFSRRQGSSGWMVEDEIFSGFW